LTLPTVSGVGWTVYPRALSVQFFKIECDS
jgi:hypothetical protein